MTKLGESCFHIDGSTPLHRVSFWFEAGCRNGSSRSEYLPQSGTILCIRKENVREVWKFSNGEMCEMLWFSFLIAYPQNCVFWNWSQLPAVAWHFQSSILAVQSRIATGPLSRNDGPLRHIWAGTYRHCVGHRVLRCTTPSAASARNCVIVFSPKVVLTPSLDCQPRLFQARTSSGTLSCTLRHRVHVPGPLG